MNSGLISTRYAKALYSFADDTSITAKVYDEMKVIVSSFESTSELSITLKDPVLSKSIKKQILQTSAGINISNITSQFIDLVLNNKREDIFQLIALRYIDIYRKKNNIHKTVITTASDVNSLTEKRLIEFIKSEIGGIVEFERRIDEKILGGFVIEVDNKIWDGSLSRQLLRIKEELYQVN